MTSPKMTAGAGLYRLEGRDGLATIRLACGKANALNARSLAAIRDAFAEAGRGGARGVVLTGYDRFFSAGLDLVSLYELDRPAMDAFMRDFDATMLEVFEFPRPVVAAVGGHAVAGGAVLAFACDARLMAGRGARFGLNEIRLGVPFPAPALEIVRHAAPPGAVEPVLYGGELHDAEAALAQGLVQGLAEGDVVTAALDACARLAEPPPAAFAAIKAALKEPAVARARARLEPLRAAFVDAWFSAEGRRRIGEARARLMA